MTAHQINRVTGKIVIVLSVTALLTVLSGYTHPRLPDEGAAAHLSAVDRRARTDDLTFPWHGGLEAAVARSSIPGISRRRPRLGVWSLVLPGALPVRCDTKQDQSAATRPSPGQVGPRVEGKS